MGGAWKPHFLVSFSERALVMTATIALIDRAIKSY